MWFSFRNNCAFWVWSHMKARGRLSKSSRGSEDMVSVTKHLLRDWGFNYLNLINKSSDFIHCSLDSENVIKYRAEIGHISWESIWSGGLKTSCDYLPLHILSYYKAMF
jgi:hypothetical protein